MAVDDVSAPLLVSESLEGPSEDGEVIVDIESNGDYEERSAQSRVENPFEFLGAGAYSVPPSTPLDPFRNHTPDIEGIYEWVKTAICLPVALVRLVFFWVVARCGFVATKFALLGWKDKDNPMPRWRCRVLWITRLCSRAILFSFGYHWIRRKGKPVSRETAPIVVCNHVSFIEPIFFFYELFPTIVASESHDSIPFVGTIIRAMQVEYLPVITPLENKKENIVNFAERTSYALANALNVVQTSHSYGDLMLLTKAYQMKQERPSNYMLEMARVESSLNISKLEAVEFLDRFLSMNPNPSGQVKIHDFLRVLQLPNCSLSQKIYEFIDLEKLGSITFRQFIFGSAHILKQPLFWQACELSFAECDTRGSGYISEQQVCGLFDLFDADGDGRISKDDFMICLQRNPLLVALFYPRLLHKDIHLAGYGMLQAVV